MSTSYYLRRIPKEEEIQLAHQLLDSRRLDSYDVHYNETSLENIVSQMTEKLHIGNYSGGWRFLFKTHTELYDKSIASCMAYLKKSISSGLWKIIDECGDPVQVDDFEKLVCNSLSGITIEDYYQEHPEDKRWAAYGPQQEIATDGSRWWDADFCSNDNQSGRGPLRGGGISSTFFLENTDNQRIIKKQADEVPVFSKDLVQQTVDGEPSYSLCRHRHKSNSEH